MQIKYSSPVEALNLIVVLKPRLVEINNSADNLTIESHLSVEGKENLGSMDSKCFIITL